jgi:hypothetical protein
LNTTATKQNWVRVRRGNLCPVCERNSWCTVSADGEACHCMRIESDRPCEKGGWIHRLRDPIFVPRSRPVPKVPVEHDTAHWSAVASRCFDDGVDMRAELADELGLSIESLERLDVGRGVDNFRSLTFSTWPEKNPAGEVVGIIRRYRVPVTDGGGCKMTMAGSHHGIYLPEDWQDSNGPVLVVEGGSDVAACLTLDLAAIGRPSCLGGAAMLAEVLRGCNRIIIVLGENDRKPDRVGTVAQCPIDCGGCPVCWPGKYGAIQTAKQLKTALRANSVQWRVPPTGSKDARAWLNTSRKPTGLKLLGKLSSGGWV